MLPDKFCLQGTCSDKLACLHAQKTVTEEMHHANRHLSQTVCSRSNQNMQNCARPNPLSGHVGILMYLGFVCLMAEDFIRSEHTRLGLAIKYVGLLVGAAVMCVLAIWA